MGHISIRVLATFLGTFILSSGTVLFCLAQKPMVSTELDAMVKRFLSENRTNGMIGIYPTKTAECYMT